MARTADSDRSAAYANDALVRVIEDTIRAEPMQRRLYPDLYAEIIADKVRAAFDVTERDAEDRP